MATNPYYQLETFRDGDVVTRQGDEGRELYVVHSGRVRLTRDDGLGAIVEETRERGGFFGELSLFRGVPREETAIAVGPTKLLVLEAGSVLLKIRRDPTFAFAMLQRLSQRVVELDEARRVSAQRTRHVETIEAASAPSGAAETSDKALSTTLAHRRPTSSETRR
jgi:CRP/FNR family transcriptional regulator, cyclic AMP receptor protein